MAAASSGRHGRSRKLIKGGTTSTRKHRFESFNQRIARLNIDPVRRRRYNQVDEDELSTSDSFFRASLDRWKDLNLSENFTTFVADVDRKCNNLPQVLHHNHSIFDLLVTYIGKEDAVCLEPLLDLLSNFAHDLGVRFEDHFSRAVTLVAALAAHHTDVEVIEWSFTCLAWLFKYLSRLLIPNLRPVFAVMAPLLGREPQKLHTTRFAAEAMSFLVRKAASIYVKDQKPLKILFHAIYDDMLELAKSNSRRVNISLYQHGLMTLLFESIRGIERKLYSSGIYVYRCMIECLLLHSDNERSDLEDIVGGVTVALIHHSDADNFRQILDILLEQTGTLGPESNSSNIKVCGRLLFIVSTVRKGTRIYDWAPIMDAMLNLLGLSSQSTHEAMQETYKATAVIFQSSPLDLVIPNLRAAMNVIASERHSIRFLPFCNYFCDLDRQRFEELLLPYFSKFIISKWQDNELELCLSLPRLVGSGVSNKLSCPLAWQEHIVRTFEEVMVREELVIQCNSYLEVIDYISLRPDFKERIRTSLEHLVDQEFKRSPGSSTQNFALGNGLKALVQQSPKDHLIEKWPLLCTKAVHYGSLPPFLEAVLCFVDNNNIRSGNIEELIETLIENAHSGSHDLRRLSLRIMHTLYEKRHCEHAEILTTALAIENSPLDLQSARTISMQSRRLALLYESASTHEWLQRIVPHFCFGMLTYKLSQAWEDAIIALKQICAIKVGEEIYSSMAFRWLAERDLDGMEAGTSSHAQVQRGPLTSFQCSNLLHVEDLIHHDESEIAMASQHLQEKFEYNHTMSSNHVPNASTLALRVLLAVPHVAEKRSRVLVPNFLTWALDEAAHAESSTDINESTLTSGENPMIHRLKRRDHKAMLDLIGSFHNPRVLYRSSEVLGALQGLLANGNVEIQKSALKAIFTWKLPGIVPYQENLLNLLDEARFRDEIATFLQVDEQNSIIQAEHRPELMPILLRLLYGKMIGGTGSGSKGQVVKRKAVLAALSRLDREYLMDFVNVALGRLSSIRLIEEGHLVEVTLSQDLISVRTQLGLMNMLKDMLEVLGDRLSPFAHTVASGLLYCLIRAARALSLHREDSESASDNDLQTSLLKAVRQTGLHCVSLLFRCCPASSLSEFVPMLFEELLSPRLEKHPIETAQSVSGTLQLLSTWASSRGSVLFLVEHEPRTVNMIIDCLGVPSAKDEVRLFVLDHILKRVVCLSKPLDTESPGVLVDPKPETVFREVLQPNMESLLSGTGNLLRKSPSKDLLASTIDLISAIAPLVKGSSQVVNFLEICTFLLDQPSHRVNPRSKGELLQVVQHFVPLVEPELPPDLQDHIFCTVSSLFAYFKDRENRVILSRVLSVVAEKDAAELRSVAELCVSLNAFSPTRVDEPDFDVRLKAFNAINETGFKGFSTKQWRPILYNLLFYVKDSEELAIRSNASYGLRRFVEMNPASLSASIDPTSSKLTKNVLLPALRTGVSESSELVRTEYLNIMAHLIRHNPEWDVIKDMSVLQFKGDEEASFFNNILHIQQHRRIKALGRLADASEKRSLNSVNVVHFCLPLIEHFVFDKADDESAHNLSAETVKTIGKLAASLEWPQFRAVLRRYSGYIHSKPDVVKTVIRLIGVVIDALSQATEERDSIMGEVVPVTEVVASPMPKEARSILAITIPRKEKLIDDLTRNLLPALEKYLHDKDESTVSLRIPVAISVVKLLKLLPPDDLRKRLPPILEDVCHILRSRSQDSRDLTRKTLAEISTLIGPTYFGFILRELRSSLARGYQLHVLSYTVHSILVATKSAFQPGDLDYCLPQVVAIVMEDIFGATGQEKDAEEYISQMKEIKSSKSYDSLELAAKTATVEHFKELFRPLQVLLEEKLDLRMVKKIDELLRRIGVGLLDNAAIQDQKVLIFCYEIIGEVYAKDKTNERSSKEDSRTKRFLVNHKGSSKIGHRRSTSSYNYKLARFALDLLRSVLRKYDNLRTPENLTGFIPIVGDAILQSNEEIQIAALRLLVTIIRVPLAALDENAAVYVAECVKMVKESTSTNVELAQAALKLVSAILRERRTVEIRETDLAYLLKRLVPDLEEPDKQGVAFNFLKALMTRRIVITEIYEIMDTVAVIMVTNQTAGARDMARGAYVHFIMDYPQSKKRFSKQIEFLVQNLDYKHQEGRQSVMEAIHLLLAKISEDLVQELVDCLFLPLIETIVNDESQRCREMAGTLVKKVFERADTKHTRSFLIGIRGWLGQSENPIKARAAIQTYGLYLDTHGTEAEPEIKALQTQLTQILTASLKLQAEDEWELLYFALNTLVKIFRIFPTHLLAKGSAPLWSCVRRCLPYPHAWVKITAAKLLGIYFADFARINASNVQGVLPLNGSGGLQLSEQEIIEVTRSSLGLLRVPNVSEDLASQTVRNLVFLGKIMAQTSMTWPQKHPAVEETDGVGEESSEDERTENDPDPDSFSGFDEPTKPALGHLITQASRILRRGPLTTQPLSLVPLHASLQLLGALSNALSTSTLTPHLSTLLVPLHNLTDPTIAAPFSSNTTFTDGYKALVGSSQELLALLQTKLGTTEYVNLMSKVREGVKARREGRRVKRRIEMVAEPERAGKAKVRKGERKRERRKERSGEQRGLRRGW